jgi:hypothetical protein
MDGVLQPGPRAPSPARSGLAGLLVGLAVLVWAAGMLIWMVESRVTDQERFSDIAVSAIRSEAGRDIVRDAVVDEVVAQAADRGVRLPARARAVVGAAAERVVASPAAEPLLRQSTDRLWEALLEDPDQVLRLDLEPLRPQIVQAVRAIDPLLVRFVPTEARFPAIEVPLSDRYPVVADIPSWVDAVQAARWVALLLAGGLIALALLASPHRPDTARRAGVLFLALAVVPVAMRLIVPPIVGAAAPDGDVGDLARGLAADLLGGWWVAALLTALLGLLLIVGGAAARNSFSAVPPAR